MQGIINLLIGAAILVLIFGAIKFSIRKEFENEDDYNELKSRHDYEEDFVYYAKDFGIYGGNDE